MGRGGLPSAVSLNREAGADPALSRPELPIGRDVRGGRFYFWLLDKAWGSGCYRKVQARGEGPQRMKGMVQTGLITWQKVSIISVNVVPFSGG